MFCHRGSRTRHPSVVQCRTWMPTCQGHCRMVESNHLPSRCPRWHLDALAPNVPAHGGSRTRPCVLVPLAHWSPHAEHLSSFVRRCLHDVPTGPLVPVGRRTQWPPILGHGVKRPYRDNGGHVLQGGHILSPMVPPEPFVPPAMGTPVPRGTWGHWDTWGHGSYGCPGKNKRIFMGTDF